MLLLNVFVYSKYDSAHKGHNRSENSSSGRLQEVKNNRKSLKPSAPNSGRGRLQQVLVCERFLFWISCRLGKVVAYERWSHMEVQL